MLPEYKGSNSYTDTAYRSQKEDPSHPSALQYLASHLTCPVQEFHALGLRVPICYITGSFLPVILSFNVGIQLHQGFQSLQAAPGCSTVQERVTWPGEHTQFNGIKLAEWLLLDFFPMEEHPVMST